MANVYGSGLAPFTTFGLPDGLELLVPFGNPCVVVQLSPEKGKLANRAGRMLGMPSDTPKYLILLDPPVGASSVDHEAIASVDVVPRRSGEPWRNDALGRPAPGEGISVADPHPGFVPLPSQAQATEFGVESAAAFMPGPA